MKELFDVTDVTVNADGFLILLFENGVKKRFDMNPLFSRKPFQNLKGNANFYLAKVEYGTVVWPGDIDIDPETLYEQAVTI